MRRIGKSVPTRKRMDPATAYHGAVEFIPDEFLGLLTHYTDGQIPPGCEVINFGPSSKLQNWYAFLVNVRDWPGAREVAPGIFEPFHFRFEGDKIAVMQDSHIGPVTSQFHD